MTMLYMEPISMTHVPFFGDSKLKKKFVSDFNDSQALIKQHCFLNHTKCPKKGSLKS